MHHCCVVRLVGVSVDLPSIWHFVSFIFFQLLLRLRDLRTLKFVCVWVQPKLNLDFLLEDMWKHTLHSYFLTLKRFGLWQKSYNFHSLKHTLCFSYHFGELCTLLSSCNMTILQLYTNQRWRERKPYAGGYWELKEATADFSFTVLTVVVLLQLLPSSPLIPVIFPTTKPQQQKEKEGKHVKW